jgi:Fur family ferric uptake transcriptional regulator
MEQDVFKDMLREKGLKVTNQRMLVLELMAERPGQHLTAEEIYDLARQKCPEIGLATIYRTVQVLINLSIIDKVSFDDGFARYELGGFESESRHHHHHAICSRCGKVFSFKGDLLDTLEQALLDTAGFFVTDHEVKLHGYCRECRKAMEEEQDGKS